MTRNVLPPTIARLKAMGVQGVDVTCRECRRSAAVVFDTIALPERGILSGNRETAPVSVRGVWIAAGDPDAGLARDESVAGKWADKAGIRSLLTISWFGVSVFDPYQCWRPPFGRKFRPAFY